jgi:NADPH:quinone reductase
MLTLVRALLLDEPGPPEHLRIADIPSPWQRPTVQNPRRKRSGPAPGPGAPSPVYPSDRPIDVLIKVEAVGLNPVDFKTIQTGHPSWTYPHIPGLDIAGMVVAVHASRKTRQENSWMIPEPGARVVLHQDVRQQGGFAEYVTAPPEALAVLPRTIDPIAAASLPCAGLSALDAVERRLRNIVGQTVLIHGGSGGVGGFSIQLAKLFGARVIASARPENEAMVRALGAMHVLDYRDPNFGDKVLDLAPGGVDAIIDAVSAASATAGLRLLRHAGHMVCVAGRPDMRAIPEFGLAPTVSEIAVGAAYTYGGFEERRWLHWGLERLMNLIVEGHIHPLDIHVVSLEEIPWALRRLANREVPGKLVANLRWH